MELTEQQALNPLNILYKKDVKRQKHREANPDPKEIPTKKNSYYVIENNTEQLHSIDQAQTFIADKYANKVVTEMSKLPFNYKSDFKLNKIIMEQERRMKEKKLREQEMKKKMSSLSL